jgi:glycine hydroxymethyltransferase
VGITVNKNAIPFDPKPPRVTSGIRIGTPAITTRGFTPEEMPLVADLMDRALTQGPSEALREEVRRLALEPTPCPRASPCGQSPRG